MTGQLTAPCGIWDRKISLLQWSHPKPALQLFSSCYGKFLLIFPWNLLPSPDGYFCWTREVCSPKMRISSNQTPEPCDPTVSPPIKPGLFLAQLRLIWLPVGQPLIFNASSAGAYRWSVSPFEKLMPYEDPQFLPPPGILLKGEAAGWVYCSLHMGCLDFGDLHSPNAKTRGRLSAFPAAWKGCRIFVAAGSSTVDDRMDFSSAMQELWGLLGDHGGRKELLLLSVVDSEGWAHFPHPHSVGGKGPVPHQLIEGLGWKGLWGSPPPTPCSVLGLPEREHPLPPWLKSSGF